jgi:hypothetical protein
MISFLQRGEPMARYVVKKIFWHLLWGAAVWLLIDLFSPAGARYAGWFAGFLGACYLLAGWLSWLRSRGTDLSRLLRRKRAPEVPYYLRGPEKDRKTRLSINGNRHFFDDDLADSAAERVTGVPRDALARWKALAFLVVGVLLLTLSAL